MKVLNIVGYVCIPLAFVAHFLGRHHWPWEPKLTFVLADDLSVTR